MRGSGSPAGPACQPSCPALSKPQGDNSNGGMWRDCPRGALPTLPPQTLVLLRWCQNVRHPPWLCCCQRCRWLGRRGRAGRVGAACVSLRQLTRRSWGPPGQAPRDPRARAALTGPHPAPSLFPLPTASDVGKKGRQPHWLWGRWHQHPLAAGETEAQNGKVPYRRPLSK